jgi:hypothetical protein
MQHGKFENFFQNSSIVICPKIIVLYWHYFTEKTLSERLVPADADNRLFG